MEKFNWEAYNVYTERVEFKTLISKYESGSEQRRAKWAYPLRRFILQFEMSDWQTEAEEIFNFFIARKGSFEAFEWDNPNDNKTYTVRFEEDFINLARFAYQLYSLGEVQVVEVK